MDPTLQFYLQGVEFPATTEEVAAALERNGAPWMAIEIRNADAWRFDSPEEVIEELQRKPSYHYNREDYHDPPSKQ